MKQRHPGLALVLVGHSMGGMIGARYAQLHGDELVGLVLSGPVLGTWTAVTDLLDLDEIPDDPLDVSTLSRDPRVGEVYAADELVWHGPFKRSTLEAIDAGLQAINAGPSSARYRRCGSHGEDDQLVPARRDARRDRGARARRARGPTYSPAPGTRSSTRPTATRSSGSDRGLHRPRDGVGQRAAERSQ